MLQFSSTNSSSWLPGNVYCIIKYRIALQTVKVYFQQPHLLDHACSLALQRLSAESPWTLIPIARRYSALHAMPSYFTNAGTHEASYNLASFTSVYQQTQQYDEGNHTAPSAFIHSLAKENFSLACVKYANAIIICVMEKP